MIPITKPFMPRLEEYESYVRGIWQRQWLNMKMQTIEKETHYNYSYFPIILPSEVLKQMEGHLIANGIYPRRYFYPSLHTLRLVEKYECTNSQYIAQRVMCLPMHHDLSEEEMHMIVRILLRVQNN
jgi:dTDP-4-amino-4,6-dideoxygalactose transaminase